MSTSSRGATWVRSAVNRVSSGKRTVNLTTFPSNLDERRMTILGPCSCVRRSLVPAGKVTSVGKMFCFSSLSTSLFNYVFLVIPNVGSFFDNKQWQCSILSLIFEPRARQKVVNDEKPVFTASSGKLWFECSIRTWWSRFSTVE